ncbi:MAG: type II secretion system protein GspC [bacterium]
MRINTRVMFNVVIFFAIAFFSFSMVMLILSMIVKDNLVFVPIEKEYFESIHSDNSNVKKAEFIVMGEEKDKLKNHNIFDSSRRTIQFESMARKNMKQSESGAFSEGEEESSEMRDSKKRKFLHYFMNPSECPLYEEAQLLGTVIAIPYEESTASIMMGGASSSRRRTRRYNRNQRQRGSDSDDSAHVISVRSQIPDSDISVSAIGRNFAILSTPEGIQCIGENVGTADEDESTETAEKKPSPARKASSTTDDFDIRKLDDGRYVIKREDIMKATTNLNSLAREARIVPSPDGDGFRIFRIRPNSIYKKIGIQNGDVVQSINGIDISSPDKALQAYQKLRNADKLSLNIKRNNKKESLEYVVE